MKKLKLLIKSKTKEWHWFFIGGFVYLAYIEFVVGRKDLEFIDAVAFVFFGLVGGVAFFKWITDDA